MKTLIGHRGIYRLQENSLESIISVYKYPEKINGYQIGVEFDIQMIRNGEIICLHDDYSKITDEKIIENCVKFSDLIDIISEWNKSYILDIELKYYGDSQEKDIIEYSQSVIRHLSKISNQKIILSSFNSDIVKYLLTLKENNKYVFDIALISHKFIDQEILNNLIEIGLDFLILNKKIFYLYKDLYKEGKIKMKIYTLFNFDENEEYFEADEKLLEDFLDLNIGLISDDIDKIIEKLNS